MTASKLHTAAQGRVGAGYGARGVRLLGADGYVIAELTLRQAALLMDDIRVELDNARVRQDLIADPFGSAEPVAVSSVVAERDGR